MAERPEDLNLPNAVVGRIIKDAIPEGVNVSKEARLAISKAASVFVLYATSCSNNYALKAKRKTISAQDVLSAMEEMDFEQFVEPLTDALEAFRSQQQGKKERKKEKESSATSESDRPEEASEEKVPSDEDEVTYQGEEKEDYIITVNEDVGDDDEEAEEMEAETNE
ncbi:DNA polymerase epsilon subunit 3-like [Babylonia areolata]|uniref:DNA polymerase epsilon subunit 3-like n=1 Tax=Babylonia areolata TaxID=304850 RepID=UPI003FD45297